MKKIKSISWFLGVSLFLFGILKFIDPFKGWYTVQITNSGLGEFSYALGIFSEITVGTLFLFSLIFKHKLGNKFFYFGIIMASTIVLPIMFTGIYVHLKPNVPAAVLPLKIKPPYIPGFFLLLALVNIVLSYRQSKLHLNT